MQATSVGKPQLVLTRYQSSSPGSLFGTAKREVQRAIGPVCSYGVRAAARQYNFLLHFHCHATIRTPSAIAFLHPTLLSCIIKHRLLDSPFTKRHSTKTHLWFGDVALVFSLSLRGQGALQPRRRCPLSNFRSLAMFSCS
jgi:hypothetical protein